MSSKVLIFLVLVVASCKFVLCNNNALQSVAANLQMSQKIRHHLISKYAHQLVLILNESNQLTTKLEKFTDCLIAGFNKLLVDHIFATTINGMLKCKTPEMLVPVLRHIYQQDKEVSFEVMLQAQLHLFEKIKNGPSFIDAYILSLAFHMSQVMKDELYKNVPSEKKIRVDALIASLPGTVQNFFFNSSFCLQNKAHMEYIYTPWISMGTGGVNAVFSWSDETRVGRPGLWSVLTKYHNSNETELNLSVALKSVMFAKYLYLEPQAGEITNLIGVWLSKSVPPRVDWSVQLLNDHLIFEQNGLFMCNSRKLYNTHRRYVQGFNDEQHTRISAACQWIACQCE